MFNIVIYKYLGLGIWAMSALLMPDVIYVTMKLTKYVLGSKPKRKYNYI